MDKKDLVIIVIACLITAILVGLEVYLWQGQKLATNYITTNSQIPTNTQATPNTDTIKTKAEGIAACEQNRLYANAKKGTEEGKIGMAMVDYCYSVIAAKFNDLSLCSRAFEAVRCQESAKQIREMGKEMQNLSPEEQQQLQQFFNK